MQAYDVLDPGSTISGSVFIEASAGTGKTFAIEHMVLRLILQGICITEILVVTFTKAGARDLKKRIHSSLMKMKDLVEEDNLCYPYLKSIGNKQEAMLYIENACALSSEMAVCTIHSFTYQMLSSFAFEAGIDFDLLNFEDEKQKDLTHTAILDTLRSQTSEEYLSSSQCTKMMDLYQRKLSSFTKKVASLIDNEKNLLSPPSWKELNLKCIEVIGSISYEKLEREFVEIAARYKKTTNRQKEIHPHFFDQLQALCNKDLDFLVLSSPSIIELLQDDNLKKGAALPKDLEIKDLCKRLLPIFSVAKDPLVPITHIAIKTKKRLEKMAVKGPDSILFSMVDAIKKPLFKKKIEDLFSVCIIDEFQDTDPVQWSILSDLFFSSTKLFCTVGDPKQSIYAFRGADLPTYLKAKESFCSHYSLDTNFRSNKRLIDALNTLFSKKNAPGFLSFAENSLDLNYREVQAGKDDPERGSVELLLAPPPKKKTVRSSLSNAESLYFFPHIAKTIQSLDIDLNDIAILVKDRYQGLAISLYLQSKKIPVKANISSSLLDSSLFSLFETLLFLTYNPRSESLIKKLLTHPVIDAPVDLLKEDLKNPLLQKLSIDFTLLNSKLAKDLPSFLYSLMETKIFNGHSLGELICKKQSNYLTMMQIFSIFLSNFDKDPKGFLSDISKLNPDVFSFLKKSCGTDKKSVTIMTSHLSKGLEFDVVFALSLYTRMKLSPKNKTESMQIDKEKMRLLYVTLTRAKSHLFVYGTFFGPMFPLIQGCGSPLELFFARLSNPFLNYEELYQKALMLNADTVIEKSPIPASILPIDNAPAMQEVICTKEIFTPMHPPVYRKKSSSYSFSSLPFKKNEIVRTERKETFPFGSKVGNQIHLLLEKIIEEGLYYPFSSRNLYPVVEKNFAHTPLSGYEDLILKKLEEVFKAPLKSDAGIFQLEDIPPHHMWGETLFHYKLENSATEMKGFSDLIVFHNDKYYIIDWKCNHLEEYSKEYLLHTINHHHYNKQAAIYSRALESFLKEKNLSFDKHAGGAFYIFIRGGGDGVIYLPPKIMTDEEILCLI